MITIVTTSYTSFDEATRS